MARRRSSLERSRRRRRRNTIVAKGLAICAVAVVSVTTFAVCCKIVRPFRFWSAEKQSVQRMQSQLASLERENADMRIRKMYLTGSQGAGIEARKLGYVSPGEISIFVEKPTPKPAKKSP